MKEEVIIDMITVVKKLFFLTKAFYPILYSRLVWQSLTIVRWNG